MHYRKDITGLRAVAVLPILLFHAGVEGLPGGFTGVDIFFVISGYLITSILVHDLQQDRFSVLEFYRRRVARILPALLVMLAATLVAGYLLLLPEELSDLAASTVAAALFYSNIHFYLDTDYFGRAAESIPLLHTWSLAVEEQFYIFYPPLLWLVWKWRPAFLRPVALLGCGLSFAMALYLGQTRLAAAFYLLPARAWELGLGALVALDACPAVPRRLRDPLALIGLAAIGLGLLMIRPGPGFPAPLGRCPRLAPCCSSPMARAR